MGDGDVPSCADGCAADGGQLAPAYLDHPKVDMALEGVIEAAGDAIVDFLDADGRVGGLGGTRSDGSLEIGLIGTGEGFAGDANTNEEVFENGVVSAQVVPADVDARGDAVGGVVEVVVAADIHAPEHAARGGGADEGEVARIQRRVADVSGDGVDVEADLGVGRDGRQSEKDDCGKVPELHE